MRPMIFMIVIYAVCAGTGIYWEGFATKRRPRFVYVSSRVPVAPPIMRHRYFAGHTSNGLRHWYQGKGKRRIKN